MKVYAALYNSQTSEAFVIFKEEKETNWLVFVTAETMSKANEIVFAMNEAATKPLIYGKKGP